MEVCRPLLIQGHAESLPFASDSFDMVVSCETIEDVPNVRIALREMWRIARPGAELFLTTPNYANLMGLYDLYARVRHPNRREVAEYVQQQKGGHCPVVCIEWWPVGKRNAG